MKFPSLPTVYYCTTVHSFRYREALTTHVPCLGIREEAAKAQDEKTVAETA